MTKQEATAYLEGLAQEAGFDETTKTAVLQALANEKFAKGITDGVLRQDEFSRNLDSVRAEKERLGTWYEEAKAAHEKNLAGIEALNKYRETYGSLEDPKPAPVEKHELPANVVTREDFEKSMKAYAAQTGKVIKSITRSAADHLHRFGQPLDVDDFEKFMVEKDLEPDPAYEKYIAPKVAAKAEEELKLRIERERKEAVLDYASKHQLPVEAKPREHHPLFDQRKPAEDARDDAKESREAFLGAFNEVGAGKAN